MQNLLSFQLLHIYFFQMSNLKIAVIGGGAAGYAGRARQAGHRQLDDDRIRARGKLD